MRPNIFWYATRELSQDAVVCWLLACLRSSEHKYQKIGLNFIRFIFKNLEMELEEIAFEDVELSEGSPYKQYSHIDVYAVIRVRQYVYPIIFENKTNTYLHGGQFEKYCVDVAERMQPDKNYYEEVTRNMKLKPNGWGNLIYVYFKTGHVPEWQLNDLKKEKDSAKEAVSNKNIKLSVREIYLDDIVGFLKQQEKESLLGDYCDVLERQLDKRNFALVHAMESAEACMQALDNQYGSHEVATGVLFETIFGPTKFEYSHQQWAAQNLFFVRDKEGNETYYCFRFQECKYGKEKVPAFQLQQHRIEKDVKGDKEVALKEKVEQGKKIHEICKEIIESNSCMGLAYRIEELKEYPCKSYNGQMLMKFFIVGESTPRNVCEYINEFSEKLIGRVKTQIGEKSIVACWRQYVE